MCGILGFVSRRPEPREDQVRQSLAALQHRGPDASGMKTLRSHDTSCVLGQTRLRIIDLDPRADQPMSNEDGSVWIVYNGELYNHSELRVDLERAGHRFRSMSDTEVIIHLYEQCRDTPSELLRRLRGMFAFAIFDERSGQLLLARDRLGIKPMYWTDAVDGVAFASEVRALARAGLVSGEPDPAAITDYLAWGRVSGPRTVLTGVRELLPGCLLRWQAGVTEVDRWWSPEVSPDPLIAQDGEALIRSALSDSVHRHLIADRPVGVFLSGGLDSRAVATLAAADGHTRALTVTFPEEGADEGKAASETAGRLGSNHELVPVTGADIAQHLPLLLTAMDQPTHDGANAWIVCRAAREAGLVVALSGLGGDELFGGYPTFRLVPLVARAGHLLGVVPRSLRLRAAWKAAERVPGGRLSRLLASPAGYAGAYAAVRGFFSDPTGTAATATAFDGFDFDRRARLDRRDQVMLLEMTQYLPNQLLRDLDQMSMSHSIEVRVPLLDDILVRVALRLPASLRMSSAKDLLARTAGVENARAKRPFTLPFDRWMRGPLRGPVMEALLSDELPFGDVLQASFRRRLWEAFEQGTTHWSRPWAVTVLRLWPAANGFRWT
jgi:asparagine synthase (glutamine-hydrolysing)